MYTEFLKKIIVVPPVNKYKRTIAKLHREHLPQARSTFQYCYKYNRQFSSAWIPRMIAFLQFTSCLTSV